MADKGRGEKAFQAARTDLEKVMYVWRMVD